MSLLGRLAQAASLSRPDGGHAADDHKTQEEIDAEYERDDAERLAAMPDWARRMCTCAGGQYGGCGLVFTGVGAFDAHRTGPWSARRCLTPDELRDKGYAPNDAGRWGRPGEHGAS